MAADDATLAADRLARLGLADARRPFVPDQSAFAPDAGGRDPEQPVAQHRAAERGRTGAGGAEGGAAEPAGTEPAATTRPGRTLSPAASLVDGVLDRLPPWASGLVTAASRRALGTLALVCAGSLALTAWSLARHGGSPAPVYPAPMTAQPVTALPTPTPSGIVVDVGGRVRRPGLVTLPPGARVADALRAAGGAIRARDVATVDLAALVSDGQLLLVGVPGGAAAGAMSTGGVTDGGTGGATAPVALNTATVDQLDALPGIGPVLAQRIVAWRSAHGGFRDVSDLKQVAGIGDAIYAELAPLVHV